MSERIDQSRRRMCQAACGVGGLVVLSACGGSKMAACTPGQPGAGAADLDVGQARFLEEYSVFVCRDDKGYYAMGSQCTHVGTELNVDGGGTGNGMGFTCPLHGSTFDFDGHVTMGPALTDLPHYELCTTDSGLLIVDQTKLVTEDTRLLV
jgi:Rieske Fe-S protein